MNVFRVLILGLLAWFVYKVVRSWGSDGAPRKPRPRGPEQYEMMARCLRCGVFVPRDTLNDRGQCRNCKQKA